MFVVVNELSGMIFSIYMTGKENYNNDSKTFFFVLATCSHSLTIIEAFTALHYALKMSIENNKV